LNGKADYIEYELRPVRKNGKFMLAKVLGSLIVYDGRPAILGTVIDITKERTLVLQLRQAQNDDQDIIINVGKEMLNALGYKVLLAKSGKEALEVFEKNKEKIDLVILDMIMPVMSGGEVYNMLKNISPQIKVILSSGYSMEGQAAEILKRGCNGFIQKPFNIGDLSKKIREGLD
jgi:CheY-like chemotaxis protein